MFHLSPQRRRGLTLIELLAVVAIMVILLGVAIPLVRPLLENRKSREASRALNAYFVGAQARATQLQRPVGVWIERRGGTSPNNAESFELFMAEAPPPYAGDTETARCWIQEDPDFPGNTRRGRAFFNLNSTFDSLLLFSPPQGSLPPGQSYFVRPGDRIRFDYRGPFYVIDDVDRGNYTVDFYVPGGFPNVRIPSVAVPQPGLPYQIYRRETRSSVNAMVLPETVTIDLSVSGVGVGGNAAAFSPAYSSSGPIVIMFHPRGGIDSVRIGGGVLPPLQEPVYLLVGQADKVIAPTVAVEDAPLDPEANLADLTNLWVKINHRTGAVTTAENAQFVIDTTLPTPAAKVVDALQKARAIARGGDSMGGL
ncbi:MAG: prepilin-type N-terminal cleavage/methylation domain-containing protein [Pirellulaceae bacterium]